MLAELVGPVRFRAVFCRAGVDLGYDGGEMSQPAIKTLLSAAVVLMAGEMEE